MNTMVRGTGLCAGALAVVAASLSGQVAQCRGQGFDWGVAPVVVRNADDATQWGGRGHLQLCTSGHDLRRDESGDTVITGRFPISWHLETSTWLVGIRSGALTPYETSIAGRVGGSISLSGPAKPVDCTTLSNRECEARMLATGGEAFDWGYLALTAEGKFESSAGWKERAAAGGAALRYANRREWVPSLLLTWDVVKPLAAEARDTVDPDRKAYGRTMARGYWAIAKSRFRLELDMAAYKAHGLSSQLEAAGWDSGAYVSVSAGVDPRWALGFFTVESVFVQFADGRLPTSGLNRRAWSGGIELGQRR